MTNLRPNAFPAPLILGVLLAIAGNLSLSFLPSPLTGISSALADDFNPPDRGLPGRRRGGGTREGGCIQSSTSSLTAVIPENNLGLTIADYPQIFWFVPENTAAYTELTLYSTNADFQDQQPLFFTRFKASGAAGIRQFQIPETISFEPLQEGETYHWYVSLVCDPNDRAQDIAVSGWLERIPLSGDLSQQISGQTGLDRSKALAQSGIWFDALSILGDLQCADTQGTATATTSYWQALLADDQVKLEDLVDSPWLVCPK